MPRKHVKSRAFGAGLAVLFAGVALPSLAHAGEIQLSYGMGGEGSSWRTDGAGFGSLKAGYRFLDLVAPYISVRLGYGAVDERLLTLIQIGGQIWARIGIVRPYLRFGLVHQHEETMAAVAMDAFGAVWGVGDGIRHRGGFEGALGADIPFKKVKAWEFHAMIEGFCTGFPDPRGPAVYGGATAGLGFNYKVF